MINKCCHLCLSFVSKKMSGEKDLAVLIQNMEPVLNTGEYVFCTVENLDQIPDIEKALFFFRENEAVTIVLEKNIGKLLEMAMNPVCIEYVCKSSAKSGHLILEI